MVVEPVRGEIYDSVASTDSRLMKALKIYLQGLVVAVFGLLVYVVFLWLPLDYLTTVFLLGLLVGSPVLGTVNSRISMRFWSQDHRFSSLTVLGQGAVLMFICMGVLSDAITSVVFAVVGGWVQYGFNFQWALALTLILPPFYGFIAKEVASWRISPSDRARASSRNSR
jgi:hypothetical protein